jgi:molybdate transport system regulatory protein
MSMKTTARNQFAGTVSRRRIGPVSAQVSIALERRRDHRHHDRRRREAPEAEEGQGGPGLIKASAVVLVTDFAGWQLSARNQLAGTVSRIERAPCRRWWC